MFFLIEYDIEVYLGKISIMLLVDIKLKIKKMLVFNSMFIFILKIYVCIKNVFVNNVILYYDLNCCEE